MNERNGMRVRVQDRRIAPGLVHAAVIVVMLAVLVPGSLVALTIGRGESHRETCINNLKQLVLGMKQYSQDFMDVYPWHEGVSKPGNAWCDLGILYPNYNSGWKVFLCPASKDKTFKPKTAKGDKEDDPLGALKPADNKQVISYAYGMDGTGEKATAWTENAKSTVRLLADKKAGAAISDDEAEIANHGQDGRNAGYQDGHVKWLANVDPVDPDADDDIVGKPDADDYKAFWSDPPWYAEGMDEEEEADSAE